MRKEVEIMKTFIHLNTSIVVYGSTARFPEFPEFPEREMLTNFPISRTLQCTGNLRPLEKMQYELN